MRESLQISQETIDSYESVGLCPLCLGEHKMCCCPQLADWLQIKFRRKPGLSPRTLWTTVACSVVVILGTIGVWKWLSL